MKVELRKLSDIKPYESNPRSNDDAVDAVAASLKEFGFRQPIVVDAEGVIVCGHTRYKAALKLGLEKVPVHVARDLAPEQIKAYRIADNKTSELSDWNYDLLPIELAELKEANYDLGLLGFDPDELARLLAPVARSEMVDPDEAPASPVARVTQPGDLWLLGGHRLLCGDSTEADSVARVMGDDRAALLFTSPPYANQRHYTTGGVSDWNALMQGVFRHLVLAPAGQVLVNLGLIHRDGEWQPYWQDWLDWMRSQGWRRFGLYVWDQGPGLPGDWAGRLAPAFELIFHFNRKARQPNKIVPCKWAGTPNKGSGLRADDGEVKPYTHLGLPVQEMRIPDAVLRTTRHKSRGIETEHPAVFPIALPEFVMRAYTDDGEIVYEPFCGSGTTILAGQRIGRMVRAIELAPEYVDLAITRWRAVYPDIPVTLADDGRDYAQVAIARGSCRSEA